MKLLWLFCFLQAVLGQADFGKSYLKNSRLCHQWSCINTKLGLPDALPSRELSKETFSRLLPQGPWQEVIDNVLKTCYENRPRRYINTCPGQALLHCITDQLNAQCPDNYLRKDNACGPVTCIAGFKSMFAQSQYIKSEGNMLNEYRPQWFFKYYFDQKCCELPLMFNMTILQECGFSSFMSFLIHHPAKISSESTTVKTVHLYPNLKPPPAPPQGSGDTLKLVRLSTEQLPNTEIKKTDPLECCDLEEFIQPSWRSECGFELSWNGQERLVIGNNATVTTTTEIPVTTSTAAAHVSEDLVLLPQTCERNTCVFRKLGIIKESGSVDNLAFTKLLDEFTDSHPNWEKAKARAVTKCLTKRIWDYEGVCEINKVLACTLDTLTENCPYRRKIDDLCRHNKRKTGCQVSSSKFRPKNRREICLLPQLVHERTLHQCGMDSLYKYDHVVVTESKPKKHGWASKYLCQEQTSATTCVMSKMGILNKYNFMDYFRMKDRIRQFTSKQPQWSALLHIYMSAFINIPMYGEHCSSQKKLLNVVDAMLMTCPVSKRVDTPQCTKIFKDMTEITPVDNQNVTRQKLDEILKHYRHVFMPKQPLPTKFHRVIRKKYSRSYTVPVVNYNVFNSGGSPRVKVVDVKPTVMTKLDTPLVLKPVYLRDPTLRIPRPFQKDNALRGNPYWLHDRIAQAHVTTPLPATTAYYSTPDIVPSTTARVLSTSYSIPVYSPFDMVKPD